MEIKMNYNCVSAIRRKKATTDFKLQDEAVTCWLERDITTMKFGSERGLVRTVLKNLSLPSVAVFIMLYFTGSRQQRCCFNGR